MIYLRKWLPGLCFLLLVTGFQVRAEDSPVPIDELAGWLMEVCAGTGDWPPGAPQSWEIASRTSEPVIARGREVGQRAVLTFPGGETVRIDRLRGPGETVRWLMETRDSEDRPREFFGVADGCNLAEVRRLVYQDGAVSSLERLGAGFDVMTSEPLDPPIPVPDSAVDGSLLPVGMVDAGVNYLLPEIRDRLFNGDNGEPAGYDFWDIDPRPFDANPAASPFFVQRHGTRTASLLLAEAPGAGLVSYRYPRPDMTRMADLVEHAAALGLRIVGMPLGSNREADWQAFGQAAAGQPQILFIVSAGNNGRDIDIEPLYPAALELDNMLVVSSSDDFLRPARGSNTGILTVDYLLPAEGMTVTGFDGESITVSGSSYAVSRLAALAARLLSAEPEMDTAALKAAIGARAVDPPAPAAVGLGVIPDSLADSARIDWETIPLDEPAGTSPNTVSLDIRILEPGWESEDILAAANEAAAILSQCDLDIAVRAASRFSGSDYLRDLSTGGARTLRGTMDSPSAPAISVFFARDTRMAVPFDAEAFGPGNTSTRPWLTDSVWVMQGARDLPVTLAHELFHVLANDGSHAPGGRNLMGERSGPDRTELTGAQCSLARQFLRRSN